MNISKFIALLMLIYRWVYPSE